MGEKEQLNQITEAIIGAAIEVHRHLGPGLLESAYEACLAFEIGERGMKIEINFNVKLLKSGIRRIVNEFPDS